MYVYVAAKNGKPLMPTKRIGHVWDLLQAGKAKLISDAPQYPVIQLQYDTEILTQPLYGGTHVRGFTNYKGIAVCTAAARGQTAKPKLDASYFVPERKKWPWWQLICRRIRRKLYQKG